MGPETFLVCEKCGATIPQSEAQDAGWLAGLRGESKHSMVIRCPQHVTTYAKHLVGPSYPRIADNLDRGLTAPWLTNLTATAKQTDHPTHPFMLTLHEEAMPPFSVQTYPTLHQLIARMREIQCDLRQWRIIKD